MRKKSFETYRKDLKKVSEYRAEIEKIKQEFKLEEKEKFIKEMENISHDENFLRKFADRLEAVGYLAKNAENSDLFWIILEGFGADVDDYKYNIPYIKICEHDIWFYDTYTSGWDQYTSTIMNIPFDFKFAECLDELDEFEIQCKEKYKKLQKEKEEREKRIALQKEKEEYELYLKLKEKFENKKD